MKEDQRKYRKDKPANKLGDNERARILKICNSPDYQSLPPSQIVPTLADMGLYIASESTFYRTLNPTSTN